MNYIVTILPLARKQLKKSPLLVRMKVEAWVDTVESVGVQATRKSTGLDDEPLKGKRKGQPSIRLNRQWRLIYTETDAGLLVNILEVTAHDYRCR